MPDIGALVQAHPDMTGAQIAALAQVIAKHPSLAPAQAAVLARADRPDLWQAAAPAPTPPPAAAAAPAVPTPPPPPENLNVGPDAPPNISPMAVVPPVHKPPETPRERRLREAREVLDGTFAQGDKLVTLDQRERDGLVMQGLRALDVLRAESARLRAEAAAN